jgi:flagellar biosynthesis protein FlhF
MKAKIFRGTSPTEALKKAQLSYGDDIFVIETKEVRKRTSTTAPIYEVVIGIEEHTLKNKSHERQQKGSLDINIDDDFDDDVDFQSSSSYSQSRFDREVQKKSSSNKYQNSQPQPRSRKKIVSKDVIENIDLRIDNNIEDEFDLDLNSNYGRKNNFKSNNSSDNDFLDDSELFNGSMMNNRNLQKRPSHFDDFGSQTNTNSRTQSNSGNKKSGEVFIDVSETAKKISMMAEQKQQEQSQRNNIRRQQQQKIDNSHNQNNINRNNQSFEDMDVDLSDIVMSSKNKASNNNSNINNRASNQNSEQNQNQNLNNRKNEQVNTQNNQNNFLFDEIKTEITALNDRIKTIQNMFWEEKAPAEFSIPPEFSEIYKISKQSGMKKEHLDTIMKLSLQHMPMRMRQNTETVKKYFSTLLRRMIPTRSETPIESPNKKIMMLVGPTGVGKTTTIAKLAARYSLGQSAGIRNYKVGLIILDTYKIGAVEQLMQYARMMKLNVETVVSPQELNDVIDKMNNNDYILIDTMGSSPYDLEKIGHIKEFLNHSQSEINKIDVMLVMPSSLKYEDLKQTYDNFSILNIDTIMFTKLDETKGFGNIFSLVHDIKKPISYFSTGQEVPEDIVMATTNYLVDTLLHGFKRDRQ